MSLERPCYRHPNRMTAVSCSDCGRPICPDCMNFAAVGIKCPDHAGGPGKTHPQHRPAARAKRAAFQRPMGMRQLAPVTRLLIAINVAIYLIQLGMGAGFNTTSGWIWQKGVLVARAVYGDGSPAGVAHGEWWRLITAAFLHANAIHLLMNMFVLWVIGSVVEQAIGSRRFTMLYAVAGVAGSAGALIASPNALTVGASGAIFGIMGALLVLEYQATGNLMGQAMTMIIINVAISFGISGISIGGHIGGLVGGVLAGGVLSRFGRSSMAYGRLGLVGVAALVAIGVASVLIAYAKIGLL